MEQKRDRILKLKEIGQSLWYDNLSRELIQSGELKRLIEEDGILGITSNPSIFEKAITKSRVYSSAIKDLIKTGLTPEGIYEQLAVEDIKNVCELFKPIFERTRRRDGYVSLEVSPFLADKTQETIAEAKRLWERVDKANLMIKIPATNAGIPAIYEVVASGISVNVTLIFSMEQYEAAANAYISGLERRAKENLDLANVSSVASFFISRIDSAVDKHLPEDCGLCGKTANANAKLAYQCFERIIAGEKWKNLSARGANLQRLLWGSTSTKNPKYNDLLYVEELIGPNTINTVPPATLTAFLDHGKVRQSLTENLDSARTQISSLSKFNINFENVCRDVLKEGVNLFSASFTQLLNAIKLA